MVRGTTPKLEFNIPFDVSIIKNLYITFYQSHSTVMEKTEDDCELNDHTIICHLKQEDTLVFDDKLNVNIQLRIKTIDGEALASEIITDGVKKVLKDGEI